MTHKKVLLLGSGALMIGQAGEFDYSGSQAIKALKEEGVKVVLVNPNIATFQTSVGMADKTYFLPVTAEVVERIIIRERPDGIFLAFGGQTALNCGIELEKRGILKQHNVQVLGTQVKSIRLTEDRELFARHLSRMGIPTPKSISAKNLKQAELAAKTIGFPVMLRAAYALGGQSSGVMRTMSEFRLQVKEALSFSPQVLVEQYLKHYKEIEYEVVRDSSGNMVAVCNMENMDPLGIHTGESIVVAPSQTLANSEYHLLRKMALELVSSLQIVGECNVQYALNPQPKSREIDYYVIEVNARLSRSSALASKATGYPLAYVAAKIGLGKKLFEIPNQVTGATSTFFEPALDYLVVKMPRWDLDKFVEVDQTIGSSMKSVGEVMAIGRSFEEVIQKAVRMLDLKYTGVTDEKAVEQSELEEHLTKPTTQRLFALVQALMRGRSVEELHQLTGIDNWFLYRLRHIVEVEQRLRKESRLTQASLRLAKEVGTSDVRVGELFDIGEEEVWNKRQSWGILPRVFQIDTLAGEFPAKTNYLYTTYLGDHDDVAPLLDQGVMVLGSGPYRIGSSVEFDWTTVRTAQTLPAYKKTAIIINCNPETVSTDFDISGRLYFEELTLERVRDIFEFEQADGVIVSVGGQTPNNLVEELAHLQIPILGTSAAAIDQAENRSSFSAMLDRLSVAQPAWIGVTTYSQALSFAKRVGFPVLVRPSYVLSGKAMQVCYTERQLTAIMKSALALGEKHPVTISQFIDKAREIEFDAVAQQGELMVYAISEHLEHAGVHSGDATIMYPAERLYVRTSKKIMESARCIVKELKVTGPINIQFVAKKREVMVIEVNLRASRTFPFISKATGVDFAQILVDALFLNARPIQLAYPDYAVVKVPQFSFSRLRGADPQLRVEMASTGEAAAFGSTVEEAYLKAKLAVGAIIPRKGIFISLGGDENKVKMLSALIELRSIDLPLYATAKTAQFMRRNGIKAKTLYKVHERREPTVLTYFQKGKIDLAINIVDQHIKKEVNDDYIIRRMAIDHNVFLITNRQQAELFIKAWVEHPPSTWGYVDHQSYIN